MPEQRFTVNSSVAYDQAGQQDHLAELSHNPERESGEGLRCPAGPCLPPAELVKGAVCLSRSFIICASEPFWREHVSSNLKGSVKETPGRGLSRDPLNSMSLCPLSSEGVSFRQSV
jgi:hypothetical protein